jgi:hypothetical protein
LNLDRVMSDILDGEVTDTEDRGKLGAAEGGSTCSSLILVKRKGERLARKGLLDACANGRHASRSSDELDGIKLVRGQSRIS